ncbi:MAG TPA: YkvA family protein [Candidatus Limnocylindria bacterium]|nr:YkvA family protein [Candidatus Limnocylindria bacterium]
MPRLRAPRDMGEAIDAARKLPTYARLVWGLARDPRVSIGGKAILAGVVGYLVLPIDVVPDFLPVVGQLDDLAVLLLGVDLFIRSAPDEVVKEHLARIDRGTDDLARDAEQVKGLLGDRYARLRDDIGGILEKRSKRFRGGDEAAAELERWHKQKGGG